MNIFFQFILIIFLILVLLVPFIAPMLFNVLGILFVKYIIPYEMSNCTISSILVLSFTLTFSSLFVELFLILIGFNHKVISNMLKNNEILGFIIKLLSEMIAILIGYTFLKSYDLTNITLYRTGLLLFAFTSSTLNLIFTFCKSILYDDKKNNDNLN